MKTAFLIIRTVSLVFLLSILAVHVPAGESRSVLSPRTSYNQVWIDELPPGTEIHAYGLKLRSGVSEHFKKPPKFCLFSSSRRNPKVGLGYPETGILEEMEIPNSERYPLQLRDLSSPSISGFEVVGLQSRDLPWRVVKAMWDGDALHVKGCEGDVVVSDVYWENVEDGFGPNGGIRHWTLRRAYMKYIRDDAVENDALISGEIDDCLIDGCFTFLSQRAEPAWASDALTVIRDSLIHVEAQPHDGSPGKQWRDRNIEIGDDGMGRAPGMLFKWDTGAGRVEMENCVVRIDACSVNGKDDMVFPPGVYKDVTLIWMGRGRYPADIPEGITITDDLSIWNTARRAWIERLDREHPAYFLKQELPGAGTP